MSLFVLQDAHKGRYSERKSDWFILSVSEINEPLINVLQRSLYSFTLELNLPFCILYIEWNLSGNEYILWFLQLNALITCFLAFFVFAHHCLWVSQRRCFAANWVLSSRHVISFRYCFQLLLLVESLQNRKCSDAYHTSHRIKLSNAMRLFHLRGKIFHTFHSTRNCVFEKLWWRTCRQKG